MTDNEAATAKLKLDIYGRLTDREQKLQEFLNGINKNADIWIRIDPKSTGPGDQCVTLFARHENSRDSIGGLDKAKMLAFAKELATQELFKVRDEIAAI